jgi:hypothetical protein
MDSTQCSSNGLPSPLSCFWLFSSNTSTTDDGECRAKDDESLKCSDVKRSTQCRLSDVTKLDTECVWVEEEKTPCQEVKTKCQDLGTEDICETAGAAVESGKELRCVWVDGEPIGDKCQPVKSSCEDIKRGPTTCNYVGAAVPEGEGKTALTCFWLYDSNSGTSEDGTEGRCENAVCLREFFFFFFFLIIPIILDIFFYFFCYLNVNVSIVFIHIYFFFFFFIYLLLYFII